MQAAFVEYEVRYASRITAAGRALASCKAGHEEARDWSTQSTILRTETFLS